ncbi:MAG: BlaI/MecI/CopY family transcriptional regulator [Clostridiales bacterium]|nr:BlaI/MecI/CopY family transcriptional regulator [Clostridiales bacterium]
MEIKLFDSELKVMDLVWNHEPISAKDLSMQAKEVYGWNKNTTYTVIKKLLEKEALLRTEPNFMCRSLIKREQVQKAETNSLINKLYQGSKKAFFATFLKDESLTKEDYEELRNLIDDSERSR